MYYVHSFKSEMLESLCVYQWVDALSSFCSGCQRGRQRHLSTNRQRMGRQSYLWCTLPSPTPSGSLLRRPHTLSASWKNGFTGRPQGLLQTHIHSHCLSLRYRDKLAFRLKYHSVQTLNFVTSSEVKRDLLSCRLPFLSLSLSSCLVAKEPHCKPLGRSLYLHSFQQGQLFEQSCSSWHKRWGVCLTLPFPNQQQSSPERQSECSSQGSWPHFSHEQSNGRLWVGKLSLWIMPQLNSFSGYIFLSHTKSLLNCWVKPRRSKFKI